MVLARFLQPFFEGLRLPLYECRLCSGVSMSAGGCFSNPAVIDKPLQFQMILLSMILHFKIPHQNAADCKTANCDCLFCDCSKLKFLKPFTRETY
jgi:hypothetical protein